MLKTLLKNVEKPLIGVDEVGRGCLAGPVCAGAVILNHEKVRYSDSKILNSQTRAVLALQIHKEQKTGIGFASVEEIDQMNILQASLLACRRAVLNLKIQKGTILIDGKYSIPHLNMFSQIPIIKGDSQVNAISAASIIAKHFRDEWLKDLSKKYPGYGFEKHKGYPTSFHRTAIQNLGSSPIHRKSFSGVKEYL